MDILNLEENKRVYKKNYLWKKNFSEILKYEIFMDWVIWGELRNYELTNSGKIKKVMTQYRESLHNCNRCNNRWILWMIQENVKKWNQIIVEDCLTCPVNQRRFQYLLPCWAATNACHLIHGTQLDYRKTFLVINFPHLVCSEILLKEFIIVSHMKHRERQNQSHKQCGQGPLSQEMTSKIRAQFGQQKQHIHFYVRTAETANIGIATRQIP